jgi:hypothetical protein
MVTMQRQGDVLIQEVAEIPPSARRRTGLVLASGETTGHSHRIKDRRTAQMFSTGEGPGAELFLEVTAQEAKLVHPEHETIILPKGRYRVWRQREFHDSGTREMGD